MADPQPTHHTQYLAAMGVRGRDGRSDLRRAIANVVAEAGRGAAIGFGLAGPIRPARGIGMLVGAGLFGGSQAVIEAGRLVTGRRVPSDPMPVANMTRLDNVARRALIEGSTTGVVSLAYDVLARAVGDRRVTPGSATHHAAYAVAGGIAGEGVATAIVAVDRAAFDSGGYLNLMGETASAVLNRFSSAISLMRDAVTRAAAAAPPRPARAAVPTPGLTPSPARAEPAPAGQPRVILASTSGPASGPGLSPSPAGARLREALRVAREGAASRKRLPPLLRQWERKDPRTGRTHVVHRGHFWR